MISFPFFLVPQGQTLYTKQKCKNENLNGACFDLVNAAGSAEVCDDQPCGKYLFKLISKGAKWVFSIVFVVYFEQVFFAK